jgi:hypothetical protein
MVKMARGIPANFRNFFSDRVLVTGTSFASNYFASNYFSKSLLRKAILGQDPPPQDGFIYFLLT